MNKILKWILIAVGCFIALVGIALVSLPFFINPNEYKEKISQVVQERTGRELSIPGDIHLKVSPRLDIAFSLGEIQLAAGNEFPGTPFASSKLAEIKLALWPLLSSKQLQINSLTLEDVQLNLIRNKKGVTNWQDLVAVQEGKKAGQPPKRKKEQPAPAGKPLAIDIGGIRVKNINVRYQDEQSGRNIALSKFNLDVGHLQEGKSFPVAADFVLNLNSTEQKPMTATIATRGDLTLFFANQRFILSGFSLKGLFEGDMFPSSKLELKLLTDAEINIPAETVQLRKFSVQQGNLTAETTLSLTGFKTPSINGTLRIPEYSPRTHLTALGITLPDFSDPQVLGRLAASFGFSLDGDNLAVKDIDVQLDDTTIKATASVSSLKHPAYELVMNIDQFDLDRYAVKKEKESGKTQPSGSAETEAPQPAAQEAGDDQDQIIIPVHLLKDLLFSADITIGALKAAKLRTTDIVVKADGKNGLIRLEPLAAKLYDGSLTVTGKIDVREEVPELQLKKVLQGVQMGPLFVDLTGREEISGRAELQADVVTHGLTRKELTKNANGKLNLSLDDGRIARLQILQTIRVAKALIDQQPPPSAASAQPTGFATLTASGKLTNGVFQNNDLLAESDLMKVTGKGTVDLVNEQIDYLLTVYLTDRVERERETGLVALGNTPIPYRIKGSFTKLKQSAALEELVKAKAEKFLLDNLQKQLEPKSESKDAAKDAPATDAGSLINRGLKGLFGN